MKKIFTPTLMIICLNVYCQTSLPDTDPSTIPTGISYQNAQGTSGGWTYNFGTKLTVWGSSYRNFEIMNTNKGPGSTLALRTYDPGVTAWTDWREFLFRSSAGHLIYPVNTYYTKQQTDFNGDFLLKSSNTAGKNGYGAAVSFSKINGGSNKRASIAAKQTGSDQDVIGISFFTHTGTAADDLIERMVIEGNGQVGIGTSDPKSTLEVFGNTGLTIADDNGNEYWSQQVVNAGDLHFYDNAVSGIGSEVKVTFQNGGNVGIGTTNPDEKLTVNGRIHTEEVKVDLSVPGPDYVFEEDYDLRSLEETEAYIMANKHLPEIPSAKEMEENGVVLGEMNMLLLKKIEELTLHVIELKKNQDIILEENADLKEKLESITSK